MMVRIRWIICIAFFCVIRLHAQFIPLPNPGENLTDVDSVYLDYSEGTKYSTLRVKDGRVVRYEGTNDAGETTFEDVSVERDSLLETVTLVNSRRTMRYVNTYEDSLLQQSLLFIEGDTISSVVQYGFLYDIKGRVTGCKVFSSDGPHSILYQHFVKYEGDKTIKTTLDIKEKLIRGKDIEEIDRDERAVYVTSISYYYSQQSLDLNSKYPGRKMEWLEKDTIVLYGKESYPIKSIVKMKYELDEHDNWIKLYRIFKDGREELISTRKVFYKKR